MSRTVDDPPRFFLNTFHPLARTGGGREASRKHRIPPFVDGSIRREPDFQHRRPSISCLCRGGKFAPRLREGDFIAYLTVKGHYGSDVEHRRFVALLRVIKCFESHKEAAAWYRSKKMKLPSNCMVPGNRHEPLSKTSKAKKGCGSGGGCNDDRDGHGAHGWDRKYLKRARKYPCFLACTAEVRKLGWNAPIVHDKDLIKVFRRVPATRTPGVLPITHLKPLLRELKIAVPPSVP